MTQVDEALHGLLASVHPVSEELVSVREASGRVAADDVIAPHPIPDFRRAAMDGYVCHEIDVLDASAEHPVVLRITGSVQMGQAPDSGPGRGETWSITTGGAMPRRGDRVLRLETVRRLGEELRIDRPVEKKTNVAEPGEELRKGTRLLTRGSVISAATAAALTACGIPEVKVFRQPRVAVIATGDELLELPDQGGSPPPGRLFNSNSVVLAGELKSIGCRVEYLGIAPDEPDALRGRFEVALRAGCDVVLSTGGVSVGPHDRVHRSWLDLGAKRIVGRVDLKPGGPFFAGQLSTVWALGLSGTPVACLAMYHLVVRPLLLRLGGRSLVVRPLRLVALGGAYPRETDRMRALWARVRDEGSGTPVAEILTGRQVGNLASVLTANALLLLPPGTPPLPPGSRVSALILDQDEDREDLDFQPSTLGPLVIGVIGESSGGKTMVISGLLQRLQADGIRIVVVKHAPHGFELDRPGSDSSRMMAAGAAMVVLAGPAETALRTAIAVEDPDRVVRFSITVSQELWGEPPDVVLIEGFSHPTRPVILVGPQKTGAVVGEVWATIPSVTEQDVETLESEVARLAKTIQTRLHRSRAPAKV